MNRTPIVIVEEKNDTQEQQQIQNINSKKYRNTKKNADLDNKCGKEYLKRAKETREDKKQSEKEEEIKLAARHLIDSAEKYAKANAIIHGEENNKYCKSKKNLKKIKKVLKK